MQRAEALKHIGKPVLVRSIANGAYTGELLSLEGSPWRGLVRVDGIVEPAVHFEQMSGLMRRGYRIGEFMEAPANAVTALSDEQRAALVIHTDYAAACESEIERCVRWAADHWFSSARPDYGNTIGTLVGLRAAQFVERRRQALAGPRMPAMTNAAQLDPEKAAFVSTQQSLRDMLAAQAASRKERVPGEGNGSSESAGEIATPTRGFGRRAEADIGALKALWPEALEVPAWSNPIEKAWRRVAGVGGRWVDWDLPTLGVAAQALEVSGSVEDLRLARLERIVQLHAADAGYELGRGAVFRVLPPSESEFVLAQHTKAKDGRYEAAPPVPPVDGVWSCLAWVKSAPSMNSDTVEDLRWMQATFYVRFVEGLEVPAWVEGRTLPDGARMVTSWEITRSRIRAAKEAARAVGRELTSADMDAYRLPSTPLRTTECPPGWAANGMGRFARARSR